MAEDKDIETPKAPEGAEVSDTAETQVVDTEAAAPADAPVETETPAEPVVEEAPVAAEAPVAEPVTEEAPAAAEAPVAEPVAEEAPAAAEAAPVAEVKAEAPAAAAEQTPAEQAEAAMTTEGSKAPDEAAAAPAAKRGRRMGPSVGIAHIRATFNNTLVSISDMRGGVISWSSAGRTGFKGSRKSTAFAATMVGQDAARQAVAKGMHEVEVHVQGAGSGRESAIRALQTSGLVVTMIKDVTPMPHNGCRQRKRRRV
jgi:small subunit ribosomal protein S11